MVKSPLWSQRKRPARLERRLEFADYEHTRRFLEDAASLSEAEDLYPDLSFGRTYVSITLHADSPDGEVDERLHRFAAELDRIVEAMESADGESDGPAAP